MLPLIPAQDYPLGDWESVGAPLLATYPPFGDIRENYDAHFARRIADPPSGLEGLRTPPI